MFGRCALVAVLAITGCVTVASTRAQATAPQERSYTIAGGPDYMVGQRDLAARSMPALNGMPTNREVLLDSTFYAKVSGSATGTLETGYLVACTLDTDAKAKGDAGAGVEGDADFGVHGEPGQLTPKFDGSVSPNVHGSLGVEVSLTPGKIADVTSGSKDLRPGATGYVIDRDFYVQVSGCAGPLLIRPYAKVQAKTQDIDASGSVLGDSIML